MLGLTLDYLVRHTPEELDSTCFVEIGPGPYSRKHWQPGFTFVPDDAFAFAQGIVSYHFPAYDPYAMNELPAETASAIAVELRAALQYLTSVESAIEALRLGSYRTTWFRSELRGNRDEIREMLSQIASALERSAQGAESVCVLGM